MPYLRRPPAAPAQSSSSCLLGLERSVPSFQSFIDRTPPPTPPTQSKPLPPIPLTAIHAPTPRRSSSVYSRTVSAWAPTPESWRSQDLAATDIFIEADTLGGSYPQLVVGASSTPPLLQYRTYAPLIDSPCSTPSLSRSPSRDSPCSTSQSAMHSRSSVLLPPPPIAVRAGSNHVKTVSLNKAKAALQQAGTAALLPEEMRALAAVKPHAARELRKSRSLEMLGSSRQWLAAPVPPPLLNLGDYKAPFIQPTNSAISTPEYRRHNLHVPTNKYEVSYEARGRTTERMPPAAQRLSFIEHPTGYGPPLERLSKNTTTTNADSGRFAEAYYQLLHEQSVSSGRWHPTGSLEDVAGDMKLVPQPLFFNPRQISDQRARQYQQIEHKQNFRSPRRTPGLSAQAKQQRRSPARSAFPLKLTLSPEAKTRRRQSTSGIIPISPPQSSEPDESPTPFLGRFASPARPSRIDSPRKIGRKLSIRMKGGRNSVDSTAATDSSEVGSAILGRRLSFGTAFHKRKPSKSGQDDKPRADSVNADAIAPAFVKRFVAVKEALVHQVTSGRQYGHDLLNTPDRAMTRTHDAATPTTAGPSNHANMRELSPNFSGFLAPMGPGEWLRDSSLSMLRKPSVMVSELMDHRREHQASRRREELKKTIKVVPEDGEAEEEEVWF